MGKNFDVIIIGAGVTGSAIARELSRYNRKVCVLEMASDVCEGTSKANSGICHAGFDAKPGSLKAKLNLQGNQMMEALSKELDFPFKKNGSLIICNDENSLDALQKLYERGVQNGVQGLKILNAEETYALEPNLTEKVATALYAPTGGIVCPFGLTIALAENACVNGVEFFFNTKVNNVVKKDGGYDVETTTGTYTAEIVINAAGVFADVLHNMVSEKKLSITARKGEYCLFDKQAGNFVSHTVFQLPTALGKGILVTPTTHGNLLIGPNACDIEDKEDTSTTQDGLNDIISKVKENFKDIPMRKVITSFSGLRAHEKGDDFVIGEAEDAKGWIDVAGIESPGLTCAPATGKYVADLVNEIKPATLKDDFIATRKGVRSVVNADPETLNEWIKEDPSFANVICRCETITEGEIIEAINRPLGATTIDGIKRRTRAGMGRCQAGFCLPKQMEILERTLAVKAEDIVKSGKDAKYFM